MDFELTEEHQMSRKMFREVAQKEIAPLVEEYEEREEFPVQIMRRMGELGLLCMNFPKEYGAAETDTITFCLLAEEFGRVSSGITSGIVVHSSVPTHAILTSGTEEQKRKFLPEAIRGEKIFAIGITEPNVGSDVANIETTAVKKDGKFVINGSKIWITNGGIADYIVVAATVDKSSGMKGIRLFIVPKDAPGFSVAKHLKKHGLKSSDTSELVFDNCRIPEENMLGENGFYGILDSLTTGRIVVAARAVGVAEEAFHLALKYAKERKQFGKPIGSFQVTQHKLAQMETEIQAARLLVYKAAYLKDKGMDYAKAASAAKWYASELAVRITNQALQIHGSYGYSCEYPIERMVRDARILTISEGTSEIQLNIIAKQLGL